MQTPAFTFRGERLVKCQCEHFNQYVNIFLKKLTIQLYKVTDRICTYSMVGNKQRIPLRSSSRSTECRVMEQQKSTALPSCSDKIKLRFVEPLQMVRGVHGLLKSSTSLIYRGPSRSHILTTCFSRYTFHYFFLHFFTFTFFSTSELVNSCLILSRYLHI